MIKTRVIEIVVNNEQPPKIDEKVLGWTLMHEVPVEKKVPEAGPGGKPPTPLRIKVNGRNMAIIGHSWDIQVLDSEPDNDGIVAERLMGEAVMVLFVQGEVVAPSLVRAPAAVLDVLKAGGGAKLRN